MNQDKFSELELTPEEQNEFKGGFCVAEQIAVDIENRNSHWGCSCSYNNRSKVSNINEGTENCTCSCV